MAGKVALVRTNEECRRGFNRRGGGGDEISISQSVGQFGKNQSDDVLIVQQALNSLTLAEGGPEKPLKEDGASGPFTIAAIMRFQKTHSHPVDGRIDPGHATLKSLNRVLATGPGREKLSKKTGKTKPKVFPKVTPNFELLETINKLEPKVREAIRAADAACVAANRFIKNEPLVRKPDMTPIAIRALQKLDFVFSLTKFRNPRPPSTISGSSTSTCDRRSTGNSGLRIR